MTDQDSTPPHPTRRAAAALAIALVVLSPWIVGAAYTDTWLAILSFLTLLAVAGLSGQPRFSRLRGPAIAVLSLAFTVTASDLLLRPVLPGVLYHRPYAQYLSPWPPMPWIRRYPPNYHWSGTLSGDMARSFNARKYREYRHVEFITDELGYRNHPVETDSHRPPLDVIVLGDSYGEGEGTTQEKTWASLLGRHLQVYNLSILGNSPWEEYATLAITAAHLPIRPGTVVVWALFNGNDLDDGFHPVWTPAKFPWSSSAGQRIVSYNSFRDRSPIHLASERLRNSILAEKSAAKNTVDANPVRELPPGKPVLFLQPEIERAFRTYGEVIAHPHYLPLTKTIGAMQRLCVEKHLTLKVILLPTKQEVYAWLLKGAPAWSSSKDPGGLSHALSEICKQKGLPYFDAKADLIDESRRAFQQHQELLWWRDDTHMNERGQEAIAALVQDKLLGTRT